MDQRRNVVSKITKLSKAETQLILQSGGIDDTQADLMIENCIGGVKIPLGLVKDMSINGKKYWIPMATEEPSVIAAANYASKLIRKTQDGFFGRSVRNIIRG